MEMTLAPEPGNDSWTCSITLEESPGPATLTTDHTPPQSAFHSLAQNIDEAMTGHTIRKRTVRFIEQVATNNQSIKISLVQSGKIIAVGQVARPHTDTQRLGRVMK